VHENSDHRVRKFKDFVISVYCSIKIRWLQETLLVENAVSKLYYLQFISIGTSTFLNDFFRLVLSDRKNVPPLQPPGHRCVAGGTFFMSMMVQFHLMNVRAPFTKLEKKIEQLFVISKKTCESVVEYIDNTFRVSRSMAVTSCWLSKFAIGL